MSTSAVAALWLSIEAAVLLPGFLCAQSETGFTELRSSPGAKIVTNVGTPSVFGTPQQLSKALCGRIFFLEPETPRLPDFRSLDPVGTIYTPLLNVPTRHWLEGFPGVTDRFEWFAIEYLGRIRASRKGRYWLRLVSDDGSKLYVDNRLVVNDDGIHPTATRRGSVELDEKPHTIKVQYFQGPRDQIALQLFCRAPGGPERLFPNCGLELETTCTEVESNITYHAADSTIRYGAPADACRNGRNGTTGLCTPARAIVEEIKRSGEPGFIHYHVVLPGHLQASVLNPAGREPILTNQSGRVCWDLAYTKNPVPDGCSDWRGNGWKEAGAGFVRPHEKAGALVHWTDKGKLVFSVNGREDALSVRNGLGEFRDYEGYFEFDVAVARR